MTSIGPYTQSYNFTHMWDIRDLRGCLPKKGYCENSLMDIIAKTPGFSKFKYIIKLAKMDGIYNADQADFTLFVPSDKALADLPEGVLTNMDDATARNIVMASTLNRRITGELLADSPACSFITRSRINKLWVTNISGQTYLNNDIKVVDTDIEASNGLIHVVDGLIWPLMV